MKKSQFLDVVFDRMIERYKTMLNNYYPAFKSNGFTERNLSFNFCNSYLDLCKKDVEDVVADVIVWQEVPLFNTQSNKHNNHIDSVIIDKKSKIIVFIEAKRIRSSKTYDLIHKDINRVKENTKIPNIENFENFEKYAVFLTDIWISKFKNDIRKKIKLEMEMDFGKNSFIVLEPPVENKYEDYYINYKIIKL